MHTQNEHIVHIQSLQEGTQIHTLPSSTSAVAELTHGDIRDLHLTYDITELHVISYKMIEFMRTWGLTKQISRLYQKQFRFDIYQYGSVVTNNTLTFNFDVKDDVFYYKCNSRAVFKTLNQIKNSLQLLNQITDIKQTNSRISTPENWLLHYCLQPISNTSQILNEIKTLAFSIPDTIANLDSPIFKHKLKMIHPTTVWTYDTVQIRNLKHITGIIK